MATLTPIAGPPVTVTALTGLDSVYATFSGASFTALPTITGMIVDSATQLRIPPGRISAFA